MARLFCGAPAGGVGRRAHESFVWIGMVVLGLGDLCGAVRGAGPDGRSVHVAKPEREGL